MYTKVSIPKKKDDGSPGAPLPKKPSVIVFDIDDIETWPTRAKGSVALTGDIVLKAAATAVAVYATPSTISRGDTSEGDPDAEGFIHNVVFDHPGNTREINEFTQNFISRDCVLVTQAGEDGEGIRVHGTPSNPMKLTFAGTDNNEGNRGTFTWRSALRTKTMSAHYSGELPALAAEATYEDGSAGDGI